MMKHVVRLVLPLLVLAAACVGTQKSANPLSPSVAGPIAGVGITPPVVVSPPVDAQINTTTQPITLQVQNAVTSGVRPLSYVFEIATDPGFANKVFTSGGIPQGGDGHTRVTLSTALAPERKYYWHARAEDGANTGPFGATSAFSVFTPVVFGAPVLVAPINDTTTSTSQPRFVIGNASRSGPAGQVAYYLEIATSSGFGSLVGSYQFFESPNQTELTAPNALPVGQYFWRARAYDSGYTGPFAAPQSFRSPGTSGGGGGGGPANPGQPCGPPYPTTEIGILQCRRSQYPLHMSDSEHVAFLSGSAKDFNAAGISGGPFGILVKTGGNNCNGFSCDIICAGQGTSQKQWDVLVDETYVTWTSPMTYPGIRIDTCQIQ